MLASSKINFHGSQVQEKAWGIASYALVGTGVLIAGGYVAWRGGAEFGDIAAWVQAVGSMVAIWGAFAISRSQALNDARARTDAKAQAEREQVNAVLSILTEIRQVSTTTLEAARKKVESGKHEEFRPVLNRRVTERLLAHLAAVPLHAMPYARMARALVMAIAAIEHYLEIADKLHEADPEHAEKQLARLERYLGFMKTATQIARRHSLVEPTDESHVES